MADIIKQPNGKLLFATRRGGRITNVYPNLHLLQVKQCVMDNLKNYSEKETVATILAAHNSQDHSAWEDFLDSYARCYGSATALKLAKEVGDGEFVGYA